MSRATHVQPTERNAITQIKFGVHTDRGAWVSNSSDETRLRMPLPTNIQNVMTLMSYFATVLGGHRHLDGEEDRAAQRNGIADIELDAIECHQANRPPGTAVPHPGYSE